MAVDGADRDHHVLASMAVGIKIYINKVAFNYDKYKQQSYWRHKRFLIFCEGAELFAPKSQMLIVNLDNKSFYRLVVW